MECHVYIFRENESQSDRFLRNTIKTVVLNVFRFPFKALEDFFKFKMTDNFLPTGGKKVLYFCSCCQRDITSSLRIRCTECPVKLDICGDCFCVGATAVSEAQACDHKSSHGYRVVDCLDCPIFDNDWSAAEELLMLEGLPAEDNE